MFLRLDLGRLKRHLVANCVIHYLHLSYCYLAMNMFTIAQAHWKKLQVQGTLYMKWMKRDRGPQSYHKASFCQLAAQTISDTVIVLSQCHIYQFSARKIISQWRLAFCMILDVRRDAKLWKTAPFDDTSCILMPRCHQWTWKIVFSIFSYFSTFKYVTQVGRPTEVVIIIPRKKEPWCYHNRTSVHS